MSRFPHPADMNPDSSDPRSPYYDSSRDEWIAERADELADERMASHEAVTDAVEEVIGFSDWADYLAADMAAVLMASDAAFEAEAVRFFARLHWRVEKDIRDAAEADAERERDRWEEEQEEMRSGA
ncbi:MAG UNVERIFIED_CONTAM: hypothetical protein LOD86_18060, partial [Thermobifida fusca]